MEEYSEEKDHWGRRRVEGKALHDKKEGLAAATMAKLSSLPSKKTQGTISPHNSLSLSFSSYYSWDARIHKYGGLPQHAHSSAAFFSMRICLGQRLGGAYANQYVDGEFVFILV